MSEPFYRGLDFPFCVYAAATVREMGAVDTLHYGLFEDPSDSPQTAAQRSNDRIASTLPAAPARILEVGIGLGRTLELLTALGYELVGVTPDRAQVEYARGRMIGSAELICARFEDVDLASGAFDVVLFQESAQYIDPLVLLARSHRFLRPGGSLIIMDEIPRDAIVPYRRFAEEGGFAEKSFSDLTREARPSVRIIIDMIARHRKEIEEELDMSSARIGALLEELRERNLAYLSNRYAYVLIELEKVG